MAYIEKLDSIGESILQWADPDNQFRGYTEVGRAEEEEEEAVAVARYKMMLRFSMQVAVLKVPNSFCSLPSRLCVLRDGL